MNFRLLTDVNGNTELVNFDKVIRVTDDDMDGCCLHFDKEHYLRVMEDLGFVQKKILGERLDSR